MMSWVNRALDVGMAGLQVDQSIRMWQMQKQLDNEAAIKLLVQTLRDEIFAFKQSADEILAYEPQNPKIAAGAMTLLAVRLGDWGMTPDMFADLTDKEYVSMTIKLIQENRQRMTAALPPEERQEIEILTADAIMQPKYDYYLEHFRDVAAYREAARKVKHLSSYNNSCLMNLIPFFLIFGLPLFCGFLSSRVVNAGWVMLFSMAVGLTIAGAGWIHYKKNIARNSDYKTAKKMVKKLASTFDDELFTQIEAEIGTDYEHIALLSREAHDRMAGFMSGLAVEAAG